MRQKRRHAQLGIAREHAYHRRNLGRISMRSLNRICKLLADLISQSVGDYDAHIHTGVCDPVFPEVTLHPYTVELPLRHAVDVPLEGYRLFIKVAVHVLTVYLAFERLEQINDAVISFLGFVVELTEQTILLVDLIPGACILSNGITCIRTRQINCRKRREEPNRRLARLICVCEIKPITAVLALRYETCRIVCAHAATIRLGYKILDDLRVYIPEYVQ